MQQRKTWQLMKLEYNGIRLSVVFQRGKKNPFVLYQTTWEMNTNNYSFSDHKRIVARYADLPSCLYHILQNPAWSAMLSEI